MQTRAPPHPRTAHRASGFTIRTIPQPPRWVRLGAARTPCLPGRHRRWSRRLFVPVPTRMVGPLATPLHRRRRRHRVRSEFSGSRVAYLPVARSANTAAPQRRARPPAHRRSPRQPHSRAPPLRGLVLPVASTGILWTARTDRTSDSIAGMHSRIGAAWLRARRFAASSEVPYLRVMRGGCYDAWCESATPHEGRMRRTCAPAIGYDHGGSMSRHAVARGLAGTCTAMAFRAAGYPWWRTRRHAPENSKTRTSLPVFEYFSVWIVLCAQNDAIASCTVASRTKGVEPRVPLVFTTVRECDSARLSRVWVTGSRRCGGGEKCL
ncbi:hypothetical protein B0H14DRAFT_2681517 [Mycena olivaceomarginata]|nr:hypothetical protein B0H14DRAFT_2681517 [Mycena olivaceomarginata]